jgi:hypothetical protein
VRKHQREHSLHSLANVLGLPGQDQIQRTPRLHEDVRGGFELCGVASDLDLTHGNMHLMQQVSRIRTIGSIREVNERVA